MIGRLGEAFFDRVHGECVKADQRGRAQIIKHRLQPVVEERQPLLHALPAHARADRLMHRIGDRAEHLGKGFTELAHAVIVEQHLADGGEACFAQLAGGALGFWIKRADRFQGIAEQVKPDRFWRAWRKHIGDAAAHGEITGAAHGGGAVKAIGGEVALQAVVLDHLADLEHQRGPRDPGPRRHALADRAGGGDHQKRGFVVGRAPCQS